MTHALCYIRTPILPPPSLSLLPYYPLPPTVPSNTEQPSRTMCYKGIFAEFLCCCGSADDGHDPHHGGGQWYEVPNHNMPLQNQQPHPPNQQPHPNQHQPHPANQHTMNPYPPHPPQHNPQQFYRIRPNAGPWETLRAEQIRGGVMVPQTYDYAKGPRPDGTRTWQANWEERQTREFGAVGEGKGIL